MTELIKALILPSHLTAILLTLGLFLSVFRQSRRIGIFAATAGSLVYLVFSNGVIAAALIGPLEDRYPPILEKDEMSDERAVVLLTSFATDDREMPLSSRAGTSALYRALEASHLYNSGNVTDILVSGETTAATIMADLLVASGVPELSIKIDGGATDTFDSARRAESLLENTAIFLVTSAGHMPRAINGFREHEFDILPAPTDYKMPRDPLAASPLPSAYHLQISDLAVHEYAALLWYRLSGRSTRFW